MKLHRNGNIQLGAVYDRESVCGMDRFVGGLCFGVDTRFVFLSGGLAWRIFILAAADDSARSYFILRDCVY